MIKDYVIDILTLIFSIFSNFKKNNNRLATFPLIDGATRIKYCCLKCFFSEMAPLFTI